MKSTLLLFATFVIIGASACKKAKKDVPDVSHFSLTGVWFQSGATVDLFTQAYYTFTLDSTYLRATMGSSYVELGTYQTRLTTDPLIMELTLTKQGGDSYPIMIKKVSGNEMLVVVNNAATSFARGK